MADVNDVVENTEIEQPTDEIKMSKAEYDDLMSRISLMQNHLEILKSQPTAKEDEEEEVEQQYANVDLNELSGSELVQYIIDALGAPLMNTVMQLSVKEEIRSCREDHPDFMDYKNEIMKVASENTNLSIEQAYNIVKGKKANTTVKQIQQDQKPQEHKKPPVNHKPTNIAQSSVVKTESMSIKDAVAAALKAVQLEDE